MNLLRYIVPLLVLSILAACQPVQAPVAGTYDVAGPPIERVAIPMEDDCLINVILPYRFDGAIVGEAEIHLAILAKGSCEGVAPGLYDETIAAKGNFTGTVDGKAGTFAFLYLLTAAAGEPFAGLISVIPGSGTGELQGIQGEFMVAGQLHGDERPTYEGGYYFAR